MSHLCEGMATPAFVSTDGGGVDSGGAEQAFAQGNDAVLNTALARPGIVIDDDRDDVVVAYIRNIDLDVDEYDWQGRVARTDLVSCP